MGRANCLHVARECVAPSQIITGPKMCKSDDGLLIPSLGDDHCTAGSVVLYMVCLIWCFLGVALIADIFMAAIETITSKETQTKLEVRKEVGSPELVEREFTVKVWNDTVANLTLMALGSSAPEILLSVIEVCGNDFYSGELGPSTIVGSAAFNLFIILAVCILAIPEGESRTICDFTVFAITGTASVLSYMWLAFILVGNTPDIVDVEEGVITLLFFPVLVALAYTADAKMWCFADSKRPLSSRLLEVRGPDGPLSTEEIASLAKIVRDKYGESLDVEKNARLVAEEAEKLQKRSRAYYRVQATRKLTGGKRVSQSTAHSDDCDDQDNQAVMIDLQPEQNPIKRDLEDESKIQILFQFATKSITVQDAPQFKITVQRSDKVGSGSVQLGVSLADPTVSMRNTADMQAHELLNVDFKDGEDSVSVPVELTTKLKLNPFSMFLLNPSAGSAIDAEKDVCLVFLDTYDSPGLLAFDQERVRFKESDGIVSLKVIRKHGSTGAVSCKWHTNDGTAVHPSDYLSAEGVLEFANGEREKEIFLKIVDDNDYELEEHFFVTIENATGCSFDPTQDGFSDKCIATVTIEDDDQLSSWVDSILPFLSINPDHVSLGAGEWGAQFSEALSVNGGDEDEEVTCFDQVLHVLSVPWKLLFATVPPCRFCGGWLTFNIALMFVGLLTAVIGDLAALMGAAMGLEDSVTAITFVALGTSLPDTFASKTAATQDPHADAAIGNVTGSNAVNVFLGLGLPWLMASIYWKHFADDSEKAKWNLKYCGANPTSVTSSLNACGGNVGFAVPAGELGISVGVFVVCAICCLLTIVLRRKLYGAELGGPMKARYLTAAFFIGLWLIYVGVSTYLVYK